MEFACAAGDEHAAGTGVHTLGIAEGGVGFEDPNGRVPADVVAQFDIAIAVMDKLGLDPEKVNVNGGAIALGHPLGATGAIRAATVVHALQRRKLKYGMVTMCVGMGQGAAGILERV